MKNALKLLVAVVVASVVFTGCNCFGKMAKRQNEVTISCTPAAKILGALSLISIILSIIC